MKYQCEYCKKEIKPKGKGTVYYTAGILLCCKDCLYNHYDINGIPKDFLPELLGDKEEQ